MIDTSELLGAPHVAGVVVSPAGAAIADKLVGAELVGGWRHPGVYILSSAP